MPLNLAVFGIEKVSEVIAAHKEVQHWVIGGHSLGGSMAAHSLFQHPDRFAGLVLLASYPASSDDLGSYAGQVLSLSGSLDGLATPDKMEASKALLPANARFLQLQGGNHAYFGWYGNQSGDNAATISREEQQKIVDEEIIGLLSQVSK
jgi:pimeloyl-ACP methyl ester carboxylesterase